MLTCAKKPSVISTPEHRRPERGKVMPLRFFNFFYSFISKRLGLLSLPPAAEQQKGEAVIDGWKIILIVC